MILQNKLLKMATSSEFSKKFDPIEVKLYVRMMEEILKKYKYDMFVIETKKNKTDSSYTMRVRIAGYNLEEPYELEEKKIVYSTESLPTEKFWFKIDDYGKMFVGTFLFPSEY